MSTELEKFAIAYETLWRSRVGTTNPYDADPYSRVGRNEMADWCKANGMHIDPLLDAALIQPAIDKIHARLRREYPGERWTRQQQSRPADSG